MAKAKRFDSRQRAVLRAVRIPTGAMLVAGVERFKAVWNESDESEEANLVAAIFEAMIDTAIYE